MLHLLRLPFPFFHPPPPSGVEADATVCLTVGAVLSKKKHFQRQKHILQGIILVFVFKGCFRHDFEALLCGLIWGVCSGPRGLYFIPHNLQEVLKYTP